MGMGSLGGGNNWCRVRGLVGWLAAITVIVLVVLGMPARVRAEGSAAVAALQLNLRADPGTWAPVVGQLWQGESLTLLAGPTPDDWYQVQAGDQTGWAYGGLLMVDGVGGAIDPGLSGGAGGGGDQGGVDRTAQGGGPYGGGGVGGG